MLISADFCSSDTNTLLGILLEKIKVCTTVLMTYFLYLVMPPKKEKIYILDISTMLFNAFNRFLNQNVNHTVIMFFIKPMILL